MDGAEIRGMTVKDGRDRIYVLSGRWSMVEVWPVWRKQFNVLGKKLMLSRLTSKDSPI